jgi:hypothetical protein
MNKQGRLPFLSDSSSPEIKILPCHILQQGSLMVPTLQSKIQPITTKEVSDTQFDIKTVE